MSCIATEVKPPIEVKPSEISYRARWASIAIRENLAAIQKDIDALPNALDRNHLVPVAQTLFDPDKTPDKPLKVGIIGAGTAGLFTAMIFDHLKGECGLDVEYEILEAADEKRLGGRLYTHYFSDERHDYFDVGAMRFPEIPTMDRTFGLFHELGMEKVPNPEKIPVSEGPPKKGSLIPYYLSPGSNPSGGVNTTLLYNDVQMIQEKDKIFNANDFKVTGVDPEDAAADPGAIIAGEIENFTKRINENATRGWNYLMRHGDHFSVRSYLSGMGYPYSTIEWLETFNFGNRWYDQAFSEMVLEDIDFSHNKPWWCVEGGAQEIARNQAKALKQHDKILFGKRVIDMDLKRRDLAKGETISGMPLEDVIVTVKGEENSKRTYDAVFNSAPLASMQRMDLTGLNLNWGTKQAIRSLGYGASCKVGIRFKNLWWIEKLGINKGGVSKTDLPLRACVYPSYNIYDYDKGKAGTLLVSYSWSQEAQRIAALINRKSPEGEDELKEMLIRDLARLHSISKPNEGWEEDFKKKYKMISEAYDTHYAWDWYADPNMAGAFAYFGPGQFRNMYPWITRNNGKHIIIGEAASAHHAWVVGALESATRGVYQFLYRHSAYSKGAAQALTKYNEGAIRSPYGPLPAEYDRTQDNEAMKAKYKDAEHGDLLTLAPEGEWARQQVLFETIRVSYQGGDMIDSSAIKPEQIQPILAGSAAVPA